MAVGIDIEGIIRAGLHTGFATDTARGVKVYDTILTFIKGFRWADGNARCIVTMVAAINDEVAA